MNVVITQILLIFGCFFLLLWITSQVTEYMTQDITFCRAKDGAYYQVRNLKDKKRAANLMSRINRRIKIFLQYLRKKHYNNQHVLRLCRNYNEHQLCEADQSSQHTSYSINKGEKIVFCLRHRPNQDETQTSLSLTTRGAVTGPRAIYSGSARETAPSRKELHVATETKTQKLVDINTVMFVAIHELAHLMSHSVGHTKEFWDNMKFLLKEALECPRKIYRYVPYHSKPVQYCGIVISDTPYKL